jgi:hypothetical protein
VCAAAAWTVAVTTSRDDHNGGDGDNGHLIVS